MHNLSQYLQFPSGDLAAQMLQLILGSAWSAVTASGLNVGSMNIPQSALGDMFSIMNAFILSGTTFYILKVLYEGVAGTAHTGEWLGKQYSTFWAPIRTAGMLGLIAPVSGGYCLAQVIVMYCITMSIGVADQVANLGMDMVVKQGVVQMPDKVASSRAMVETLFKSMVCAAAVNKAAAEEGSTPWITAHQSTNSSTQATTVTFGGDPANNLSANVCGGITVLSANNDMTNAAVGPALQTVYSDLQPAVNAIVANVFPDGAGTGGDPGVTNGGTSALQPGAITRAADDYDQAMYRAAAAYLNSQGGNFTATWAKTVHDQGFAALGGLMLGISRWQDQIRAAMDFTPGTIGMNTSQLGDTVKELPLALLQAQSYIASNTGPVAGADPNATGLAIAPPTVSDNTEWLGGVFASGFQGVARAASSSFFNYQDPFGSMQRAGMALMTGATAAWVATLSAVGAVSAASSSLVAKATVGLFANIGAGVGAVAPAIFATAVLMIIPFFVGGLLLAYVLPMMPYAVYTIAVIGWSVSAVVAVVSAPIWAAVHAVPHGEGLVNEAAKAGYKLLLSLVIKPTLLVFGFFLSLVAFSAAEFLIQKTAGTAMQMLFGNAMLAGPLVSVIFNVVGMGVGALFMAGLSVWAAKWAFSLIHLIPDHAMRWGGLDDISLREEGGHDVVGGYVGQGGRPPKKICGKGWGAMPQPHPSRPRRPQRASTLPADLPAPSNTPAGDCHRQTPPPPPVPWRTVPDRHPTPPPPHPLAGVGYHCPRPGKRAPPLPPPPPLPREGEPGAVPRARRLLAGGGGAGVGAWSR